jgi:hypothetical protein
MTPKHYLRFVQALALAAALPACSGAAEPAPSEETDAPRADAQSTPGALAALVRAEAPSPSEAQPAADAALPADASYPHASGPIVPPELPAGFA